LKSQSVEPQKAAHLTQLAEGNLNLALKLIDKENNDHAQRFAEWMRACFKKNYGSLVAFSEEYHNLDKLSQKNMLVYSMNMMRESLLHQSGAGSMHRIYGEELEFVQHFSNVLNLKKIDKATGLINDASNQLDRNGSAKIIFMDLSLQLANVINP
jgi:DNA polymerase III subunit delta'